MGTGAHARRYFSATELRDLFATSEGAFDASETSAQLHELHGGQREYPAELEEHLADLAQLPFVQSTSDHSLVYSAADKPPAGARPMLLCWRNACTSPTIASDGRLFVRMAQW